MEMRQWPGLAIYLGRHAKTASFLVGVLFAVLGVVFTLYSVKETAVRDAVKQQDQLATKISAVAVDSRKLLIRLNQHESTTCTPENLIRLRGVMHDYRYTRDIGIFNDQGLLYCTTDIGLLKHPMLEPGRYLTLPVNNKLWPTKQLHLKMGPQLWISQKLLDSPRRMVAIIVKFGRFDLVLDPFFRQDLLSSLHGSLWGRVGKDRAVSIFGPESPLVVNQLQSRLFAALQTQGRTRLFPPRIDIATPVPNSNLFLFRSLHTSAILGSLPYILMGGLMLSGVIGILVAIALSPRLEKYGSLAYRIRYLCNSDHVRCLYQPIINMSDASVAGAEVLMRIVDDDNVLTPDQVFPYIISQGLTWQVDRTVTAKACEEFAPFYHQRNGMKIAFNFFPEDLRFETAGTHLDTLCNKHNMKPEDITVELTEHQLASTANILYEIQHFRDAGYSLSVDDFGTGYSNLGSIKKIMPDHLKIDRSFVFEMEQQTMKSSLIPEIIAIARAVNAELIAEGIEEIEQLTMLRDLGVEYGQGYYIAKPMPIDEFRQFASLNGAGQIER